MEKSVNTGRTALLRSVAFVGLALLAACNTLPAHWNDVDPAAQAEQKVQQDQLNQSMAQATYANTHREDDSAGPASADPQAMTLENVQNVFAAHQWANLAVMQCGMRSQRWFAQIQDGVRIAMSQNHGMTHDALAYYSAHVDDTFPAGATCADVENSPEIAKLDQMVIQANND